MKTPIYGKKDEETLMARLWGREIADDPEKFVRFLFPWGQKGTPLEKFKGPRKWQVEVLREIRDHISKNRGLEDQDLVRALRDATSSGRGIGKSALVAWLILWMLSTRIGSSVIVSANSESQLKSVTWGELSKWVAMSMNSHWWELSATKLVPAVWLTDLVEKDLKKGTRYWGAEGKLWSEENPDSYAGPHNFDGMMLVFDEASGIPNAIWDVGSGYFTEPILDRYWFAFSNPRKNTGYFYECFHGRRNFWNTRKIDSRTVEGTDKQIYEQILAEHGDDSYQARVEVMGEFPDHGDDQFINAGEVEAAMKRDKYNEDTAPVIVGCDIARFGSDKTVICVRKGRDIVELKKYSQLDTMQTVGKIIETIERYKPDLTVIDEGGLGAGVLDRLNEQRYKVRGINFGNRADSSAYGNKRAEMWGLMRDWIKGASLPDDKDLKDDLLSPTYKLNSTGAIMLESKDSMRKRGAASPDCFIAGTMIDTDQGKKPIESIAIGDNVITPFGKSPVIKTHEVICDKVTTVSFSNGTKLSGKGAHRVFTFDNGWVRMDTISVTNEIETNNLRSRMKWKILSLFYIRERSSSFKHQVDTISQGGRTSRRDYFTGGFTLNILGPFLKATTSIIKTAIGQTTQPITLTVCLESSIGGNTQHPTWLFQNSERTQSEHCATQATLRQNGTLQKRGLNGTELTGSLRGKTGSLLNQLAPNAAVNMKHSLSQDQSSAHQNAERAGIMQRTKRLLDRVFCAAKSSFSTSIGNRSVVPVDVQTNSVQSGLKTYNLTLLEDNVYYANGILVENCSDAICVTFAFPVARRKETSRKDNVVQMKNRSLGSSPAGWMN